MTFDLPFDPAMASPWAIVAGIVFATFVSEDLTCVAVGLLIAAGRVDWLPGLGGCLLGIVLGDFGIWLVGRTAGRGALRWKWVRRNLSEQRLAKMSGLLCKHGGRAAVVSRFLPGTRVPLFLAAGILGTCWYRFLTWAFIAALLWTPLLVISVVLLGNTVVEPLMRASRAGLYFLPLFAVVFYLGLRFVLPLPTSMGRAKFRARISRLRRFEFWPAWVFYLPMIPVWAWLVVRYRSFTVWTAANPGIPAGGVVGESKAEILSRLPASRTVPTLLIAEGEITERVRFALDTIDERAWEYPLILKPNAGQRGAGVKKCRDSVEVQKYLQENPDVVIAQPYHPGPFEAGIFYYRLPGDATGHIFSITDKVFPVLVGDGRSTVEQLIWSHPRYAIQAATFLARHEVQAGLVLSDGERFPLALAGNHCQGTMFRDGVHFITPALERAVDEIAHNFDGFYIGRFDVRFASEDEFREGRGFAVLELNGATSESTNLYDPNWSLWRAYRTLFRQWSLLFRIAAMNRHRGHRPIGVHAILSLLWFYYRTRTVSPLAD